MYLSAFPTLSLKDVFGLKVESGSGRPFPEGKTFYFYRGANAIFAGIQRLHLSADDNVLMPAYHCGVEVEAVLKAGTSVKFYGINDKLCCDLDDIQRKIDARTKAIFIIHYFGFPQAGDALKKICRERNIYLIEDCAHAFYSRLRDKYLGEFGDISIFSFQKSLPVPDGGALVVNTPAISPNVAARDRPSVLSTGRGIVLLLLERFKMDHEHGHRMIEKLVIQPLRFLLRCAKRISSGHLDVSTSSTAEFDIHRASWGMSNFAVKVISLSNERLIFDKRRENYEFLFNCLKDEPSLQFFYRALPEGVCPLFLPFLIERRDEVQKALGERGINTFIFGKTLHPLLPAEEFPIARTCSAGNLCLPVHQDMDKRQLGYMADVLRKVMRES